MAENFDTLLKTEEQPTETIIEQVNEDIYVNKYLDNGSSLNDVEDVYLEIKNGSLTSTSLTLIITDYSGGKYVYGESYRI